MKVFKFGGASVKDADAVRNVATIIKKYASTTNTLVIVSAMGKTTNALETLLEQFLDKENETNNYLNTLENLKNYHLEIIKSLFSEQKTQRNLAFTTLDYLFLQLQDTLENKINIANYDEAYDQIISFGEVVSTHIVSLYLNEENINNEWVEAKNFIKTDSTWREGKVDLVWTENLVLRELVPILVQKIVITQGFLGGTLGNKITTLGREGSDFSAAIFAYCLNAESVTIWKDVPGILNADPKLIKNTQMYDTLSYREAAEMTFYGANVIHPKTIKPLENRQIPLYVKSFLNPENAGTCIKNIDAQNISNQEISNKIPTIIFKPNQALVSFAVKDLTFITEENLGLILNAFTQFNIKINLMQSTAVSFSVCTENNSKKLLKINDLLSNEFEIKVQENLKLVTILHHNPAIIMEIMQEKMTFLKQETPQTYSAVVLVAPNPKGE